MCFTKNSLNEERMFLNFVKDIEFFFALLWKKTIFFITQLEQIISVWYYIF